MRSGATVDRTVHDRKRSIPTGIRQISSWRGIVVWLLSAVVRVWCRTLRIDISPADLEAGRFANRPAVILLWHNCLFVVPVALRLLRSQRSVGALISASNDGAWLARFFHYLGIRAIRGSSSRLGREALRHLITELQTGNDVAITPDGPRGPVHDMKPGALLVARRTHAPLILIGFQFHGTWRTNSWDQFQVPYPFSRLTIRCERIEPAELARGQVGLTHLRDRLLELSGLAS